MDEEENGNEEFDYNLVDEHEVGNLIFEEILKDKKEKITLDPYANLIIETPESEDLIFDEARNIARVEIKAKKDAMKNICGLNLEDCVYCVIIEEYVKNLKDRHARGEKIESNKLKTDFKMRWKHSHAPYLYNDRNYAIFPHIPERFKNLKDKIKMNDLFFACFCEKWNDGTRKLIINGNDLFPRIGRRFQDSDMPSLLNFLQSNVDVLSLSLAYNEIHCHGFIKLIDYLKKNDHVMELNLHNNEIREIGINYMCKEPEKLKLKVLRLNGNKFGVESSKEIALFLAKNPCLRHLDVAEVGQTISSLVFYTTVLRYDQEQYSKTLTILDISRPNPGYMYNFDSAHFATLIGAMLKVNITLIELHLQKYGFSCHDVELMLIDAKYNKTLLLLDLNENNIGDYGIEQFSNWFTERPTLTGLLLSHNIVTNNGARTLSFSLPFSRIRMLDLSYNRMNDDGVVDILNSIKKSSPIRHLRLFGNSIGHPTAKIVERMLISGVLVQENLDLKPYKVDDKLYFTHYPADHYKQRYYDVPSHSYPQPLKIRFVKDIFKEMAKPKVSFKYTDPVPIVQRRPKINKDHPYECVCCKCTEDQIINSLTSFPIETSKNICECCKCSSSEHKKLEILSKTSSYFLENDLKCTCEDMEQSRKSSELLEEVASCPLLDIKGKVELILQHVDSEIGRKILRWIAIDESSLEEDLNENYSNYITTILN